MVEILFSTPTLQDILTVNSDLQRPLQNFEDFPDHITEHINHYESLASFNQPCANISKIQTFQTSIQRRPQFDSVIASWEEQNPNVLTRDFVDFTTYLLTRYYNLPQDVKPRGGNAYSTRKGKGKDPKGKGRGRGRGKGKGKGKGKGQGRSLADNDYFEQPAKRPRLHERQANTVEVAELRDDSEDTMDSDTRSQSSHKSRQSSSSNRTVMLVHGTHTHDGPETSDTNPNPAIYYYCAYHGFNLSHPGYQCRVMANGDGYTTQQKQATLPSNCTPRGNDAVEPQRQSTDLKSWGRNNK
jgi:hypothetical protein